MDPIELRIKNEPKEDPEKNMPFSTRALVRLPAGRRRALRLGQAPGAAAAACSDGPAGWSGMGMAAAIRGNILRPAEARVTMDERQNAAVEMDMTDIGTGSYTIFAQIAAEGLGLPVEQRRGALGHSSYPITPGSGGSFGASSCGAGALRRLPEAEGAARRRRGRAGPARRRAR